MKNKIKNLFLDSPSTVINFIGFCCFYMMVTSSIDPIPEAFDNQYIGKLLTLPFITGSTIIHNISTGYVVSWIFYIIVVYLPEKTKTDKYTRSVQFIYNKIFSRISYRFPGFHSANGAKFASYDKERLLWLIALYNQGMHPMDKGKYSSLNEVFNECMLEVKQFSTVVSNLSYRHHIFHHSLTEILYWSSLFKFEDSTDFASISSLKNNYLKILFLLLAYEYLKEGNKLIFDAILTPSTSDLLKNKLISNYLKKTRSADATQLGVDLKRNPTMLDFTNFNDSEGFVKIFEGK